MTAESASKLPQWYCAIDGRRRGPLEARELRELADRGELSPEDLVWRDDYQDWVKASTVKGLFTRGNTTAPGVAPAHATDLGSALPALTSPNTGSRLTPASPAKKSPNTLSPDDSAHREAVTMLLEQLVANTGRKTAIKTLDQLTIGDWFWVIAKIFVASLLFQILLLIVAVTVIALVVVPIVQRAN